MKSGLRSAEIIPPGNYPANFTWGNGHLRSESRGSEIIPLGFYVESGLRIAEIIPPGNYPASSKQGAEIIPLGFLTWKGQRSLSG